MNVVIKPSNNQNKKNMAIIDNIADIQTIQNRRTPKEKKLIYQGIKKTILITLIKLHFTLLIYFGIKKH